jgi:hypothetical protein
MIRMTLGDWIVVLGLGGLAALIHGVSGDIVASIPPTTITALSLRCFIGVVYVISGLTLIGVVAVLCVAGKQAMARRSKGL